MEKSLLWVGVILSGCGPVADSSLIGLTLEKSEMSFDWTNKLTASLSETKVYCLHLETMSKKYIFI